MSDNPVEKRHGFERWVASLKLGTPLRPSSTPPPAPEGGDGSPLTLDEQATLINRLPKEVIYKLRERDSQRAGLPKTDDSTAVFTPPPELLARAKRFQAPPKPERSSPFASSPPDASNLPTTRPPPPDALNVPQIPNLSAAEAAAFASLSSDEEATTYFKPEISDVPPSVPPPALQGDISRPGDIQWIDGLASEPPTLAGPKSGASAGVQGSIAPAERRLRWVAVIVAMLLLAGIFALSRMQ
jgi:hypothetical protein